MTADQLLEGLWQSKGTDLLLCPTAPPMVRIDGGLQPMAEWGPLATTTIDKVLRDLLNPEQLEVFEGGREVDFSFSWRDVARLRGNAFMARGEVSLSLRLIPTEIPTNEDLGLPEVIQRFALLRQGLVLVTGPTGAGK